MSNKYWEVGMLKHLCAVLLFVMVFTSVASALEFSADVVMIAKGEKTTGKIYFKSDRFRMDMESPQKMTTITRMDKRVVWNIMPAEGMYMEIPFIPQSRPMVEGKMEGEVERKLVGSEAVAGHRTEKYLVTYKKANRKDQLYQWVATDINFPVRTAAVDGSWMQEYRNIKMGSQPNGLFELPEGYRKFSMPEGMNQNMMRGR
jgi:outer membrane lipoprotein-sorting protein